MTTINRSRMNEVLVVTDEVIEKVTVLVNKIKPLQDNLNKELAKTDGYAKTLKVFSGKSINYGDCLASECDEIRNSTPWKHWKFAVELDKDNLNLETADIFHFAPSVELVLDVNIPYDDGTPYLDINKLDNNIDELKLAINFILDDKDIDMELNDLVNYITHHISGCAGLVALYFSRLKYSNNIPISLIDDLKTANMEIMLLAIYIHQFVFNTTIDESIEMIYSTYVVKNTLNGYRNNNGYNDGTYIKIWIDGKEDNMVAMDIMAKNPDYTPKELYGALDEIYYYKVKLKDN